MTDALVRTRVVIPAYDAERTVGDVVRAVRAQGFADVLVVDDGSRDATAARARAAGARVEQHAVNRGKGAALRTALGICARDGVDAMLTLDADGQHRAEDLQRLCAAAARDPRTLVLGVRDLAGAGAPRANRISNGISNFFLSWFAGRGLDDTQCGLRRYPVREVTRLALRGEGYELEAEVVLRAARAGVPIAQVPIRVHYPPEGERVTHFRTRRDVPRIIVRVLDALVTPARRGDGGDGAP
jgi:glycosyltransferase involved in cell wall biosynthesis